MSNNNNIFGCLFCFVYTILNIYLFVLFSLCYHLWNYGKIKIYKNDYTLMCPKKGSHQTLDSNFVKS